MLCSIFRKASFAKAKGIQKRHGQCLKRLFKVPSQPKPKPSWDSMALSALSPLLYKTPQAYDLLLNVKVYRGNPHTLLLPPFLGHIRNRTDSMSPAPDSVHSFLHGLNEWTDFSKPWYLWITYRCWCNSKRVCLELLKGHQMTRRRQVKLL